jgi:polysaccharide biosynthesis transport protein
MPPQADRSCKDDRSRAETSLRRMPDAAWPVAGAVLPLAAGGFSDMVTAGSSAGAAAMSPTLKTGSLALVQAQVNRPSGTVITLIVVGILALVGIAWAVSETLRPRVSSVDDVEGATGLGVIGAIPRRGLRGIVLTVLRRPFRPAVDELRRVRRTLQSRGLGKEIEVLTVVTAGARRARSRLAPELADVLAQQGHDVVFVASNLRQPLKRWAAFDLANRQGLAELLQRNHADFVTRLPEEKRAMSMLISVHKHLLVLPPGRARQDPAELFADGRMEEVVVSLRSSGLIVIVDAPPARFSADVMPLVSVADATLLVVRAGSRWKAVQEVSEALWDGGVQGLGVVLVGTRLRVSLSRHVATGSAT